MFETNGEQSSTCGSWPEQLSDNSRGVSYGEVKGDMVSQEQLPAEMNSAQEKRAKSRVSREQASHLFQ